MADSDSIASSSNENEDFPTESISANIEGAKGEAQPPSSPSHEDVANGLADVDAEDDAASPDAHDDHGSESDLSSEEGEDAPESSKPPADADPSPAAKGKSGGLGEGVPSSAVKDVTKLVYGGKKVNGELQRTRYDGQIVYPPQACDRCRTRPAGICTGVLTNSRACDPCKLAARGCTINGISVVTGRPLKTLHEGLSAAVPEGSKRTRTSSRASISAKADPKAHSISARSAPPKRKAKEPTRASDDDSVDDHSSKKRRRATYDDTLPSGLDEVFGAGKKMVEAGERLIKEGRDMISRARGMIR